MELRISLDALYKERPSGPNMFMSRLIKCLESNHGVVFTNKKPHIALGVIFLPQKGAKRIVRVDGCYYNKAYMSGGINKAVFNAINKADGVIFQSEFSKKMCLKMLGAKPKLNTVIYNGVDQNWISNIAFNKEYADSKIFIATASWRNSKRPKSIVKSFIHANIPHSRLLMIGKIDKKINHPAVNYLGKRSSEDIISLLKNSNALIHLCKIESCSNSIIEALSCGIPVVCNNIGGSPELVKNDGIILKCDEPFDFKFIDEKNVDNLDVDIVADGLKKVLNKDWKISRPDLDINICAEQYYKFFEMVLSV